MTKKITLGLGKGAELREWSNTDGRILSIYEDRTFVLIWGDKRIKQLRDFLLEAYPLEARKEPNGQFR